VKSKIATTQEAVAFDNTESRLRFVKSVDSVRSTRIHVSLQATVDM